MTVSDQPKPKRVQRFGPEPWAEISGRTWSLWDLWFSVIASLDHEGRLEPLVEATIAQIRGPGQLGRSADEARLSHLWELTERLADAGISVADLVSEADLGDKALVRRARDKVSGKTSLDWRARTPAMIETPRVRLERRARYEHWDAFLADVERFFKRFSGFTNRKGFVSGGRSFDVRSQLQRRLEELDGPRRTLPDRLALYRAFHTAALELGDRTDQRYGVLGEVRTEAWLAYLSIDWRAAGMDPAAYWQDICELAVWEPYAIDHGNETAWFAAVRSDEVDLVEAILLDLETELRASVLDYHAHYAVDALASLYVASASHDRFVGLASRLGPYSWMRVDAMAKSAHSAGDTDLAVEVFRASLAAGGAEHLVSRCRELTGVELDASALGRG